MTNAQLAADFRRQLGLPRLDKTVDIQRWILDDMAAQLVHISPEFTYGVLGDSTELIDMSHLSFAARWDGPIVRTNLASEEDLSHLPPLDDKEPFEISDPELRQVAETLAAMERAECAILFLEHESGQPGTPVNFLTLGPGQKLNEMLWAISEIVPHSTGRPDSSLYRSACMLARSTNDGD